MGGTEDLGVMDRRGQILRGKDVRGCCRAYLAMTYHNVALNEIDSLVV
jgi:hypothetical protein